MEKIRVKTKALKIEVNDDGEYIVLNFSDQGFAPRVFKLRDNVQAKIDEAKEEEKKIKEQFEDGSVERVQALAELNESIHRNVASEIDAVFGAETCRKVFGDIVPDLEAFNEFFEQILPFFDDFAKERAKTIKTKYNAERVGNV